MVGAPSHPAAERRELDLIKAGSPPPKPRSPSTPYPSCDQTQRSPVDGKVRLVTGPFVDDIIPRGLLRRHRQDRKRSPERGMKASAIRVMRRLLSKPLGHAPERYPGQVHRRMNAKTLSRFDLARTTAHTVVAGEPHVTSTARRWIAGPWRDSILLVGLPLLILPACALILGAGLSDERQLNAWIFALGAQGHHLPGWLRAYGDKAVFSAYRQRLIWGPAVIVGLSVSFALADLHALVLTAYLWVFGMG